MKNSTTHSFVLLIILLSIIVSAQGQSYTDTENAAKNYFSAGEYDNAFKMFYHAAKIAKNEGNDGKAKELNGLAEKSKQANEYLRKAKKAEKGNRNKEAEEYYRKVLQLNKKDPTANKYISTIEKEKKKEEKKKTKTGKKEEPDTKTYPQKKSPQSTTSGDNSYPSTPTKKTQNTSSVNSNKDNSTTSKGNNQQTTNNQTRYRQIGLDCYKREAYEEAIRYFELGGPMDKFNAEELYAYNYSKMEAEYRKLPQRFYYESDLKRGESFITNYPKSYHAKTVKHCIYNYYMGKNNYDMAYTYAQNEYERNEVTKAKMRKPQNPRPGGETYKKVKGKRPLQPHIGLNIEAGPVGKGNELAIPVDVRLFGRDARVNTAIGARFAYRSTFYLSFFDGNNLLINNVDFAHVKAPFSYEQLSAYAHVQFNTGISPSEMNLYVAAGFRINYNFNYYFTWSKRSSIQSEWTNMSVSPQEALVPVTTTIRAQIGYGCRWGEVYLYYDYDLKSAISETYMNQNHSNISVEDTYVSKLLRTMLNKHFYGVGLHFFF